MKQWQVQLLSLTLVALVAGCQQEQGADISKEEAATMPAEQRADVAVTPPPRPKYEPLRAQDVNVTLALDSQPSMNAQNRLEIPIRVTNNGKVTLSSDAGIRLGTQIAGIDGTMGSEGAVRDFVRTDLPIIEPGKSAVVVAMIPVDKRVDGRKLNLELVQENVAWFSKLGQTGLEVGPVTVCDDKLCLAQDVPKPVM